MVESHDQVVRPPRLKSHRSGGSPGFTVKLEICSRSKAPTGTVTVPSKWTGWADSSTVNSAAAGIVTSGEGGGTASAAGASKSHIMSMPTMAVLRAASASPRASNPGKFGRTRCAPFSHHRLTAPLTRAFHTSGRVAVVVCVSNLLC